MDQAPVGLTTRWGAEEIILVWLSEYGPGECWQIIDTRKHETSAIFEQERVKGDPILKAISVYLPIVKSV